MLGIDVLIALLKIVRSDLSVKWKKTNENKLSKLDQAAREYFGSAFAPRGAYAMA